MALSQLTSKLTPRGWLIAGGSALVGIIVIYMFMHVVSKPSYSTVETGIEPAQTNKMTAALSQEGIPYELQNNGTAIAVQSNREAEARVALAGAGLLGSAEDQGFQLFENQSLGESNFQQQVTYQRALQGQLEQTIDNIQGVSGSQVELVMPNSQGQLFAEDATPSSAAVLLTGSSELSASSVRGIAQLVSSSVPGLKLDKVTITDGSGQLVWPAQGGGEGATGTLTKQEAENRYDQTMEASVDAALAQTLGTGKAQVQVYANMNLNQTTQEQLTYGKRGVPLAETKNTESLKGNGGGGAGGKAGTAAIPNYAQNAENGNSNYKHSQTQRTLGVNKTVTHSKIAPGEINTQHVSVLLDSSVPASAVPAVKSTVENAVGLETKRGDTISVNRIKFAKPIEAAAPASSIMSKAKYGLLALGALLFLFFTTRSLRKREREPIPHDPAWLGELEMPVRLSELERELPSPAEPVALAAGTPARRQVEELASSNPDRIAQQLRNWIQED